MTHDAVLDLVQKTRIIAILRGDMAGRELEIAEALAEGGVSALEVSIVSPNYAAAIRNLAEKLGSKIAIGAGTVLTTGQLGEVADAGASFIVSPNFDPEVVAQTRKLGLASFPGAYTATEVVAASSAGADAVKIFPAVSLGPEYIKALLGPLPTTRFVPTGGITIANAPAYIAAGAFALGIGSDLVGKSDLANPSALTAKAKQFIASAQSKPIQGNNA